MSAMKIQARSNKKEIAFDFSGWEFGCGIFDPMIGKACGEVMLNRLELAPPEIHILTDGDRQIGLCLSLPFTGDAIRWTLNLDDLVRDAAGNSQPDERLKLQQHLRRLADSLGEIP